MLPQVLMLIPLSGNQFDVPDDVEHIHRISRKVVLERRRRWTLVSRDDVPQLNKIAATHSLVIDDVEPPQLPEHVDRDPVRKIQIFQNPLTFLVWFKFKLRAIL